MQNVQYVQRFGSLMLISNRIEPQKNIFQVTLSAVWTDAKIFG